MTLLVSPGRREVMGGGRLSSHRKATGSRGSKATVGRRRSSAYQTNMNLPSPSPQAQSQGPPGLGLESYLQAGRASQTSEIPFLVPFGEYCCPGFAGNFLLPHGCSESWGCSAWRREGSGVTLEQLPVPEGATGRMERGFSQGGAVTGQGGTALN